MLNIINNIKDSICLYTRYFKGIKDDDNRMYFTVSEINESGYIMRTNTIRLIQGKANICACQIIQFDDNRYVPCLIKDGLFDELMITTQEFIIQHELGHFNLHQEILLNPNAGTKRHDIIEFEADEYAMNVVGKEIAISALEEIAQLTLRLNMGFGKNRSAYKEIQRRIQNLKKK